jgi:hypothetical protein
MVTSMERSLALYIDGLGFTIRNRWMPDGRLRWMSLDGAALMLQEAVEATRQRMAANEPVQRKEGKQHLRGAAPHDA